MPPAMATAASCIKDLQAMQKDVNIPKLIVLQKGMRGRQAACVRAREMEWGFHSQCRVP